MSTFIAENSTDTESDLSIDADALRLLSHASEDFNEAVYQVAEDCARQRGDHTVRLIDIQEAARQLLATLAVVPRNASAKIDGIVTVLRKIEAGADE